MRCPSLVLAMLVLAIAAACCLATPRAQAAVQGEGSACSLPGFVPARGVRPCPAAHPTSTARVRSNLLGLPIGKIIGKVTGTVLKSLGLATIVAWVVDGAAAALKFTASLIGSSTRPNLQSTWFSASYWRVAAVAALLTLPFLFAAAIHALVRSDLALLARAAFGYLPLALLAVSIAAPLTMLVVSATDEMSSFVAAASGHADSVFLGHASIAVTASSIVGRDPFIAFFAGLVTVAATMVLWIELLVREAAVYVIVLMLPLFFAAMVWPARRVWAIRAVETLFALILSKFAIVSVLALGGAALTHTPTNGPATLVLGATLVLLATFCPWALLRLLPLHEVAAAAASGLSQTPWTLPSEVIGRAGGASDALLAAGEGDASDRMALAPAGRGGSREPMLAAGSNPDPEAGAPAPPIRGVDAAARVRGEPRDDAPAPDGTGPSLDAPSGGAGVQRGDPRPPLPTQFASGSYPGGALSEPELPEDTPATEPDPPQPPDVVPSPVSETQPPSVAHVDPPPAPGDEDYLR